MSRKTCLLFLAITFIPFSPDVYAQNVETKALLDSAIAQRFTLTSFHVKIRISVDGRLSGCWEVQSEGEKQKSTFRPDDFLAQSSTEILPGTITLCTNCFEPNSIIRFESASAQSALSIYDASLLATNTAWIPDPRRIGLTPTDLFVDHGVNLDVYYSDNVKHNLLVSSDEQDGKSLVRLTHTNHLSALDIWIDTEGSKSIVKGKFTTKATSPGPEYEVQNSYIEVDSHWVLATSKYVVIDAEERHETLCELEWLSAGKSIPADVFSLSKVSGLKAGDYVFWVMPEDRPSPLKSHEMTWDGAKLTVSSGAQPIIRPQISDSEVKTQRISWLLWLNGLGVGTFLLWLCLRRHRAATEG